MYVLRVRNVNQAYAEGRELILSQGKKSNSRNGEVLVLDAPLTVVYEKPQERVLFDANRNANPFFHFAEALWYLAGRNDARWLDRFISDFSSRFAEDDGVQHGSYGFRWRRHFDGTDQLRIIAERLKADPTDRRSVLTMWDPTVDLGADKRDLPCNTQIYFRVREEEGEPEPLGGAPLIRAVLDMTVTCRSNDFVWGLTGANAVHFSVLQEYMAARIGVAMGRYYQIANNAHIYTATLPEKPVESTAATGMSYPAQISYMCSKPSAFDEDVKNFVKWVGKSEPPPEFKNAWFNYVGVPMIKAHNSWKEGKPDPSILGGTSIDWIVAGKEWLERRIEAKRLKNEGK